MNIVERIAVLSAVAVVSLAGGCGTRADIGKDRAVEIAKAEVSRRGWTNFQVEYARLEEGHWNVFLSELPAVPGGHATVDISKDGHVLHYWPGL